MWISKKKKSKLVRDVGVAAYNIGIEDVLELIELQVLEYGSVADLGDIVKIIEDHRDAVMDEIFVQSNQDKYQTTGL